MFDRHIWDLDIFTDPELIVNARKYILVILTVFCSTSGIVKISILLFYRRLSDRVVSKKFQWATWLSIGFIAVYTIIMTIVPIFGCNPISAFWDQFHPVKKLKGYTYHCFNEGVDVVVGCIFSAVQDLITAILPTFLYWNLQIPIRQKVALFGVFALGYGGVALASMRAYYSWKIYYATYDVTWEAWNVFIVTVVELHVGAFCANAPSLKIFFHHFFQEKLTSRVRTQSSLVQTSDKKSHSSGSKTHRSNNSVLEQVAYFMTKDGSTHGKSGYVSQHHAGVSVDMQSEKEVHVVGSPPRIVNTNINPVYHGARYGVRESTDTASILCGHDYDDIELGRYTTSRNSHTSSSDDAENRHPLPTSPRALEFFRNFIAHSPTLQETPNSPNSVITFQTMSSPLTPTYHSIQNSSRQKPHWQTWS